MNEVLHIKPKKKKREREKVFIQFERSYAYVDKINMEFDIQLKQAKVAKCLELDDFDLK